MIRCDNRLGIMALLHACVPHDVPPALATPSKEPTLCVTKKVSCFLSDLGRTRVE